MKLIQVVVFGLGLVSLACSEEDNGATTPVSSDSGTAVDVGSDAGEPDSGDVDASLPDYQYRAPPTSAVPETLKAQTWLNHWVTDIEPYWMQEAALGTPPGNYPTYRNRNGDVAGSSNRRPRMLARQIYAYSMGYLMTGQEALLERAEHGVRWLEDHALDPRGGCHEELTGDGTAIDGPKYAQDTAYCALGFAAYFFVTRDPEAEAALLSLRDLLFSDQFWDGEALRIRDGRTADLSGAVDQEGDRGWELVAQLDPINAFLLLSQPVLSDPSRRDQFLSDMRALSDAMQTHFWNDGVFWGVHNKKGQYGSRHVDFGHTLKAYWMMLQVDKRLSDHPYREFLYNYAPVWIERAFDGERWKKRPTSRTADEGGSDWWIYAEAEQIAATWNMLEPGRYSDALERAGGHWLEDFVDRNFNGEVISGIRSSGRPVFGWPVGDTFKCNLWKNGYHSTEHALVMTLHGHYLEDTSAQLYFALPADRAGSAVVTPYIYSGVEADRATLETLPSLGLEKVRVSFQQLQ